MPAVFRSRANPSAFVSSEPSGAQDDIGDIVGALTERIVEILPRPPRLDAVDQEARDDPRHGEDADDPPRKDAAITL